MPRLSLIVSVLNSHEVLRRQLLYLNRWLPQDCELVVVDDGSSPPLSDVIRSVSVKFALTWYVTRDARPWMQPRGRNIGSRLAGGETLLFFDIDHILTEQVVTAALRFQGDMFRWERRAGVLDENANLRLDTETLKAYGWDGRPVGIAANMFVIQRAPFESINGYDERFCGHYGGDDIDFENRFFELAKCGSVRPAELIGEGYVFPNPSQDERGLFHSTPRSQVTRSS